MGVLKNIFGGGPKIQAPPPPTPPPPIPTDASPDVIAARKRAQSNKSARAASILTSAQGLLTEANTTGKKSLLGA